MAFQNLYKEVLKGYDEDLLQSKRLLEKRIDEIYKKIPRIKEIDEMLMNRGIKVAKTVLLKSNEAKESIEKLKRETDELKNEKIQLLKENGFDANYLINIYKCSVCKDTGYIGMEKCKCFKQKLLTKYYNLSNLNSTIQKENFDTFDIRYYSNEISETKGISPNDNIKKIYRDAIEFVKCFDERFSNLLIYGETGLGKTFLCNCIAKDLLQNGKTILYLTAPQIFKKIEEYRFNKDELDENDTQQMEMIYEVDLLIIDDLGSEFSTVITITEFFNIVNTRLLQKKHTIFSTNLTLNELQNTYTDRIVSRIFAYYKMMGLFGEDIRVKKRLSPIH